MIHLVDNDGRVNFFRIRILHRCKCEAKVYTKLWHQRIIVGQTLHGNNIQETELVCNYGDDDTFLIA